MTTTKVDIDGKEFFAKPGQTILEVCRENDIYIPTLCHHDKLKPLGSCGICMVEIKEYGLVPSCTTLIADDMVIETDNVRVNSSRKLCLELLLADHCGDCVAPCQIGCPADVDVPDCIALFAKGKYKEGIRLFREKNPFPAICGRVCPRPCEDSCRRNLVDDAVAFSFIRRFAADFEPWDKESFVPSMKPRNGFKVAIIGSGPGGLSAAYYLLREGYKVTVFEALPKAGGMLRYGIPDYRLPKEILDREIEMIMELGATIRTNQVLGRDFTIKSCFEEGFQAVFLATGAHKNIGLNVEGGDLKGVIPATDFLRSIASGEEVKLNKRVAVVGGGDTAIDAARTAIRLGVEKVTVVYRRSRAEMPARAQEVEEAEEEGIEFLFLAAPKRILGKNGKVTGMWCMKMKLGELDASGRPRPEPIPGSEFNLEVDSIIAAIGQAPDLSFLEKEEGLKVEKGRLGVNPDNLTTDVPGVFSGGDCVIGPATAVEAIAAGRKAALSIDRYLKGEPISEEKKLMNITRGKLEELRREEFAHVEPKPRQKIPMLRPDERRSNFQEIELGYSEDMVKREIERCLECSCAAVSHCVLRQLVSEYEISPPRGKDKFIYPVDKSHPFIERDPNKCVGCLQCVRICHEVQHIGALNFVYRVSTFDGYRGSLSETVCQSCGECVAACPVGGLTPKNKIKPAYEVKTVCPYCGCGCEIYLGVRENVIVGVRGDVDSPVNEGNLCVKGRFGFEFINSPERLTKPLIKRNGKFEETSWEDALDFVAGKLTRYKGDQFALIGSAKCTNEENYLTQKFARQVMGTNNVDHCARLCHAPSVAGLLQSIGSGAMTNPIADIEDAGCILAIGTNTTETHPIIGLGIKKAAHKGAKIIVINPRKIDLTRFSHVFLQLRPGTDVALIMGMCRVIVDNGWHDSAFIKERCEDFEAFKDSLKNFDLEFVENVTGVPRDKIIEAARVYAHTKPATLLWSMGVTQHSHGTENVMALANLVMLTGNIGQPSSGVNPLRGQNNVQGACDMGCLNSYFPGYQKVIDAQAREKFEKAWDVRLSPEPGLTFSEIWSSVLNGKIKALYCIGSEPVLSMADSQKVCKALESLEFSVVQDIFLNETAKFADVVLPACSFAEKDGTFTSTERRIQLIRKVIEPIGEAKPDWWIIHELAKRMGEKGFTFTHPSEVMDEIASLAPIYGGISYDRLENGSLQWPCPDGKHPGTPILHVGKFLKKNGKGKFSPLKYKPSEELPDEEFPLILTTERTLEHFHVVMTHKVAGLEELKGEEFVELHPEDADRLGINDGELVTVISRRGKVATRAKVVSSRPPGVVSMGWHFPACPTNILTNAALDPLSKIPETKVCAVRIEKTGNLDEKV